jgi:HEAT repeat protein
MGKPGLRIAFAVLIIAILAACLWLALSPREPSYKGKSLSVWLEPYRPEYSGDTSDADEAVRHTGTNAIPTLMRLLRARDSVSKTRMIGILGRLKIHITPARDKNIEADNAFVILGPDAVPAVPELVQLYDENISADSQTLSAGVLGRIGPSAAAAIPSLVRGLANTNDQARWNAVWALGQIHGEPQLVVPELVKLSRHSNPKDRRYLAEALGNFGTNAKSAVPDLVGWLNDPSRPTRIRATNALLQIDPEDAAKAGVK